jgi:hypothetical protein
LKGKEMAECKFCKNELVWIEKAKCNRCLTCHPMPKEVKPVEKESNKRVDESWSEERIRDIVKDELENWHKTTVLTKQREGWGEDEPVVVATDVAIGDDVNWRQRAKDLGVSLSQETGGARKKVDVLADIAEKTKSPIVDDN